MGNAAKERTLVGNASSAGKLKIWRPAGLESVELEVGTSFQHPYPRHWHEEFFVSAITGGAGVFQFRGTNYVAGPGSVAVIAPGEVHAHHDYEGGRSFRCIHMPWPFVADFASEITQGDTRLSIFQSRIITDEKFLRSFLRFHKLFERPSTRLQRDGVWVGFFARLLQQIGDSNFRMARVSRESVSVRRAQEFLGDHYNRQVSLSDLAAQANLTPYHFHRVFCRETGMPPHAYQIHLRVMRAKALLRKSLPIAHVASLTGFADQSHLTRHFRRFMGVTPAQYAGHSKNVQDLFVRSR